MAKRTTTPKSRLGKDDWTRAALAALARGGVAAVAVEPLATRLGATKGSFYWHFANRDALLQAALAAWETETTTTVLDEVARAGGDASHRLRLLTATVVEAAERDRIGPALLANADHPAVGPALARVTETRVAAIAALFEELGFPAGTARERALLAYSTYLGHAQLARTTPGLLPSGAQDRRRYLDHVMDALTSAPSAG
ncbi:TetR/AcrR family transcriptional regulator [Streptomyces sp. NPDC051940]|uniref:TetR/AcrR family transcriptional regulator n=1 Tax=Streptomyces sp. NPDC051940 TaxID=3155675 RepID=UPI003433B3A0